MPGIPAAKGNPVFFQQPRRRQACAPLRRSLAAALALAALSGAVHAGGGPGAPAAGESRGAAKAPPAQRVVSLYPSLTAILLAIGAGDVLVGVDAFSAQQQPQLAEIAQVGGLYNPSVERVLALQPDLVVAVPSVAQRGFLARLRELGAPLLELNPVSFEDVAASVETLGQRVGRGPAARARVNALRSARLRAAALVRGRPPVPLLFVVERDPIFVAGPGSFLDDMLRAAGARNLAGQFKTPWPRVSREWLIAAAPQLLLDSSLDSQQAADWWSRWPSIPAVQRGRVVQLRAGEVTLPGPWLDRALLRLVGIVQGPEVAAALAAELAAEAQSAGADGESRGADGESSSTDDESRSADGELRNADDESRNADGESPSPDGESPSADDESRNADGDSRNADGESRDAGANFAPSAPSSRRAAERRR